ncbi:hypothetical protein QQP08_004788 [Theobroma cacao]|nr:hypothetical protein QQP08_004788 [Theobroma cacao]
MKRAGGSSIILFHTSGSFDIKISGFSDAGFVVLQDILVMNCHLHVPENSQSSISRKLPINMRQAQMHIRLHKSDTQDIMITK